MKNGVKNIQVTGYNGTHTVCKLQYYFDTITHGNQMPSLSHMDYGDTICQHSQYKFVTLPPFFVLE